MDEDVGTGVDPSGRAHLAGAGGSTSERRRRMSARRKQDAVLRLLRGEDLELVARELGVTAAELSGWRDQFLAGGEASLKSRPADARDAEIDRLQAKVGELTMTAVPGHGFETPICAYAALASGPIWSARTWAGVL